LGGESAAVDRATLGGQSASVDGAALGLEGEVDGGELHVDGWWVEKSVT